MININSSMLNNYPRGKDWPTPIVNHCEQPYKVLSIDTSGNCFLCGCEAHLPISVGNITDFNDLDQVWTNATAKLLQQTIENKEYTYCAVQHCGIIYHDNLVTRYQIGINIDESCNLNCPSCRTVPVNHTSGPIYESRLEKVNHLVKLINAFDKDVRIVMSGNGDPLASSIMRPLVLNLDPQKNQTFKLHTNGLLMKKLLPQSKILPKVTEFHISVDAGSDAVYQVVRNPGRFDVLRENLAWLRDNRPAGCLVTLLFVISSMNADDIVNFANLAAEFGFRGELTKLDNWGTFKNFADYDVVTNPNHPKHTVMLEQLQQVAQEPHIVISPFLRNLVV